MAYPFLINPVHVLLIQSSTVLFYNMSCYVGLKLILGDFATVFEQSLN